MARVRRSVRSGGRQRAIALLLAATSLSCTVVDPGRPLRAVRPSFRVQSDGDVRLQPDEGLLIVDVDSAFGISRLFFGPYRLLNVHREDLRIFAVKSGRYAWRRVEVDRRLRANELRSYLYYPLDWIDRNEFDVVAGQINYPGKLVIERLEGNLYTARVVNRSAAALSYLREHFPRLLESRPLRYTGFARDDFLPEFFEAKRSLDGSGP